MQNKQSLKKGMSPPAKRLVGNIIYPLLSLGIVLAIWAISAKIVDKAILLPMPSEVVVKFFTLFSEQNFWVSVGGTIGRTMLSFVVSFVIALAFAVLGGLFQPIHRVMSPIVSILRSIPTMAVILIIMIFIDLQNAPVYIGFLIAFPILYSAFYSAIAGVDNDLKEMVAIYKVRPMDKVRYLIIPSIAESVFDASGSTLSLTLKVVIASEVLCHTLKSIGIEMQFANLTFEISNLLAWTILAIALSMALELVVYGIKKLWEATR